MATKGQVHSGLGCVARGRGRVKNQRGPCAYSVCPLATRIIFSFCPILRLVAPGGALLCLGCSWADCRMGLYIEAFRVEPDELTLRLIKTEMAPQVY